MLQWSNRSDTYCALLLANFYIWHGSTKEEVPAKALSGEQLGAFGLTEPNAGTDAAMQQ
jgi:alkylation response protein AidB-like acyl-CoA dehydrogenase